MRVLKKLLTGLLLLSMAVTGSTADHGSVSRTLAVEPLHQIANPVAAEVSLQIPATDVADVDGQQPWIGIIIDDLGYQQSDRRVVLLPGPIACAFLPHTPYAVELAELAIQQHKEVMLHQPMESTTGKKLGPGALTLAMDETSFRHTLNHNLASLPNVSGVNNHMGSLLTSHYQPMSWLMSELRRHNSLFFIDSRTTEQTVALHTATDNQLPSSLRDVFLDNQPEAALVRAQFELLVKKARSQGTAIAIGHPYAETIAMLEAELPKLGARGISLRPVKEIIKRRQQQLVTAWHQ
ncbi:MAG: divergent polysaccharide deacetylase family protein [Immundisolibacteraceae bacterium]|nr:divergent polysaccharide deacetylase family protein [Immundisolibacteraceae bacterium]